MTNITFLFELDAKLGLLFQQHSQLTYLIVTAIIFAEVGLVIAGFLPGDSLVFSCGALAAAGYMKFTYLFFLLTLAAFLGNITNYLAGMIIGQKISLLFKIPFINKSHCDKALNFYSRYGAVTIIAARFLPFLRSIAPLIAGIGSINIIVFLIYSTISSVLWVGFYLVLGYYFGTLPVVKNNLSAFGLLFLLVLFIIFIVNLFVNILKNKLSAAKQNYLIEGKKLIL